MDARLSAKKTVDAQNAKSAGMTKKEKSFPNVLIGNPKKQIEYLEACSEVVYSTSFSIKYVKDSETLQKRYSSFEPTLKKHTSRY
jgi:hypothetical protein